MKSDLKLILLVVFAIFSVQHSILAQQKISGVVTEVDSKPVISASVSIKGTTRGVTTNGNGEFEIDAKVGDVLQVSFYGMETKEITIGTENKLNIILNQSDEVLSEVQLIGVGSRGSKRTVLESASAVDVLDVKKLTSQTAQITINDILNYAAPSFTSNPQTISDGTDHISPASLRGLGPDQVLVLINGKRRHKTALVNVNGTFGRGSVGTDMTTIPTQAIETIEILRDGAAAQYGSDAIAGVINIVLKKNTGKLEIGMTTGANVSGNQGPNNDEYIKGIDGETANLQATYGTSLLEKGYVNVTVEAGFQAPTNRMKEFGGTIFNGYNAIERAAKADGYDISKLLDDDYDDIRKYAKQVDYFGADTQSEIETADYTALKKTLSKDYTSQELLARGKERSDYNMRVGQSQISKVNSFLNLSIPVSEKFDFYAFSGYGYKKGNAAGFYRLPNQSKTYTPLNIDGFLPEINSEIVDISVAGGVKGEYEDWLVDLSYTFGKNKFDYTISNSSNASMEDKSPSGAYAGGYSFSENTANLDVSKKFDHFLEGINVAFGSEFRRENYQIFKGTEESYTQYNISGYAHDPTNSSSVLPTDFFGESRPGGIQVFPGFQPQNELSKFRTNFALYGELEADITKEALLVLSLRNENYSDFGNTLNYKVSAKYKITDDINFRGTVQTGFRAPSLHQIYYSNTATVIGGKNSNEVGTFNNDSEAARLIGIDKLKQESSLGYTAGFTYNLKELGLKLTVDAYNIDVSDRVVYTGQFTGLDKNKDESYKNPELAEIFLKANATKAAFFVNSVDSKTQGIDFVANHKIKISEGLFLTNLLSFTISKTIVEKVKIPRLIKDAGLSAKYFDKRSEIFLKAAVPTNKGNLSHNLTINKKWNVFLRNSYFGKVQEASNDDENLVYGKKIVTDLSLGYSFMENMNFTLGVNNILDIYPDKATEKLSSSGRFIYSKTAIQFGLNGRYVFARLNISL